MGTLKKQMELKTENVELKTNEPKAALLCASPQFKNCIYVYNACKEVYVYENTYMSVVMYNCNLCNIL